MPEIDPSIVVHEIKNYLDAKPVRQRLRQIHPRKAAAIKSEVEKLLNQTIAWGQVFQMDRHPTGI